MPLQVLGGGGPAAPTGVEVRRDLSSASYDAGSSVADVNRKVILYSSTEGKSYKLPNANAGGALSLGKGIGFEIAPRSKPIKILNQGTAGTDPILEGVAIPGATFTMYANSVTGVVGDWQAGQSKGLLNCPIPVTLPNVLDAGFDAGGAIVNAAVNLTNYVGANIHWARVTSTLYVFAFVDNAATSVKVVALSYVHATDTWTWGTAVTAFTSANTWYFPRVIGFANGSYCVVAFQGTANTMGARGGTISGTTITQGAAITSGAWGCNPTDITSTQCATLVADSATTFFYAGRYDGTHLGIEQFTMTGANVAATAGSTFASSSIAATNYDLGGYSPAANTLELSIPSDNTACVLSRYTVSGAAVNLTWNRLARISVTPNLQKLLYGNSSRQYWGCTTTSSLYRVVMDSGFTLISDQFNTGTPWGENDTQYAAMKNLALLSDDECLWQDSQGQNRGFTLINTAELRSKKIVPVGGSGQSIVPGGALRPVGGGFAPVMNVSMGVDINPTNRRMSVVYTNVGQSLIVNRGWYAQMYDLPRNYDQGMAFV